MQLIDYIIQRVETLGYRYEREYFDVKALPATLRNKTCYINLTDDTDGDVPFTLRNTSAIKMIRTALTLNFVTERRGLDIGQYMAGMKTALLSMLSNTGTNKIPGVTLIEITNITHVETGEHIVYTVKITYQEILS